MHLVSCCSIPISLIWRSSFKETLCELFWPCQQQLVVVRDFEYFIDTKFHQNIKRFWRSWKCNLPNGWWTDNGRTDPRQPVITIGHWSLCLLCPKKPQSIFGIKHSVLWLLANYAWIMWMGPTVAGGKITLHLGSTASVNLSVITLSIDKI